MTNNNLTKRQQQIINELQIGNAIQAFVENGKIDAITFVRHTWFAPHKASFKALVRRKVIKRQRTIRRPGYKYDFAFYGLVEGEQ